MKTLTCDICHQPIEEETGARLEFTPQALRLMQTRIVFDLCPKCAKETRDKLSDLVNRMRAGV